MIRVILCDDHAVVRRGIRDTLAEAVDIQVLAETAALMLQLSGITSSALGWGAGELLKP